MIRYFNDATSWFERFLLKLDEARGWKVLLGGVALTILYNLLTALIINDLLNLQLRTTGLDDLSFEEKFILVVFVGPIVETIIFQFLIMEVIAVFLPDRKLLALAGSTLLFALAHAYSGVYIFFAVVPGLMFGIIYLVFRNRDNYPVLMVFFVHALINLHALIHNDIL